LSCPEYLELANYELPTYNDNEAARQLYHEQWNPLMKLYICVY